MLDELSSIGYIEVVEHPEYGPLGRIVNFSKHQRVDKPSPSSLSTYFRRMIDERSTNVPAGKEGKGKERKEEAPQRPAQRDLSFDPVAVWCEEYKHEYRKNPAIDKKDAGIAHNLARLVVTEPKFRGMCKAFFADKNQRVVNAGHPISWMYTGKNRYLLDAANTPEQDIGENPERT
jgi:hypothetical protein